MRRARRLVSTAVLGVAAILGVAAVLSPCVALAQPEVSPEEGAIAPAEPPETAEARALFETGRALASEHRWEEALERFRRSLELVDRPSTRFNVGASLYALERHAEAMVVLEQYLASADPTLEAETIVEARALLVQARAAIGELTIHVMPEDARVRVDGRSVDGGERRTLALDPGPHVLRVDAEDHEGLLEEIQIAPGERVLRAVRLQRASAHLDVRTGMPAARVTIDGQDVGASEVDVDLAPGEHTVSVEVPGRPPIVREVTLAPGERLRIDLAPGSEPGADGAGVEPWVAVLAGALAAALAGAAVGIGYELGSRGAAAPSGGSSGVVLGLVDVAF